MSENSNTQVQFMTLNNSIVLSFNKKSVTVVKGTSEYTEVCAALAEGRFNDIPGIVDKETEVKKTLAGSDFELRNGAVYCEGQPVDSYVSKKLIEFYNAGLPYQPLLNFWKRLRNNPSQNSVKQLYRFLEAAECPLLEDGRFLSLKGVDPVPGSTTKFRARHNHDFMYEIGVPARMPREKVVDSPHEACGPGLHAGSFSYARNWASIVLELIIDPEHVVSVPLDHNSEKLRACEVLPVGVHTGGKFNKGVAIEAREDSSASETAPVNPASGPTSAFPYVIHKANYTVCPISVIHYGHITATGPDTEVKVKGLMRYRASKAPAAVRRYAEGLGDVKLVEAYTFTLPKFSDDLSLYVAKCESEDERNAEYFLFIHESFGGPEEHEAIKLYCENRKVVKPVVVRNKFNDKFPTMWVVVYCREQYEVVDLGSVKLDEFIADNSEGVVQSAVQIKPSKAPVGLKDAMGSLAITRLLRVTLAGGRIVFLVSAGTRSFLMRKE